MPFWKVKMAQFACLDHDIYLSDISKHFFGLVDPVKSIFYIL